MFPPCDNKFLERTWHTWSGRETARSVVMLISRRHGIALPEIFQRLRQRLQLHRVIDMAGVAGKDKLVVIALRGQHLGHLLIGNHPVMHVVAHDVRIEKVAVADLHPDANRLGWAIRDELSRETPTRRAESADCRATADSRRCRSKSGRGGTAPGDTTP